jgi:hypothetical protein
MSSPAGGGTRVQHDRMGRLGAAVRSHIWIGLAVCLVLGTVVGLTPAAASAKGAPVQVGFELTGDAGSEQGSVAGANVNPYSSGMPFAQAMIKWVDSHGGLGGREIQPVYYSHNFTSPTDFQDLCTTFFQDNHIFVDVPFAESPSEYPCFQENHAILLGAGGPTSEFQKYAGNLYGVASMPTEVYLKNYAIDVVKSHWIKPGAKVGLIYANNTDIATAVQQEVIPYLKSHGIKLVDTAQAIQILDVASFQEAQVPTQNAVLRFKQEGITQVLMPAWGEYNLLIWLRDAVPQNYFPAYAFGSGVVGGANEKNDSLLASFPIKLFNGSMLVSTATSTEVLPPVAPITLQCQSIYASEGVSIPTRPSNNDSTSPFGYQICFNMLFLKQVFAKGNVTSLASFKKAADSLGTSVVQYAGPPSVVLNASHPYQGETKIQDLLYNEPCTCYQVSDKWHQVQG